MPWKVRHLTYLCYKHGVPMLQMLLRWVYLFFFYFLNTSHSLHMCLVDLWLVIRTTDDSFPGGFCAVALSSSSHFLDWLGNEWCQLSRIFWFSGSGNENSELTVFVWRVVMLYAVSWSCTFFLGSLFIELYFCKGINRSSLLYSLFMFELILKNMRTWIPALSL